MSHTAADSSSPLPAELDRYARSVADAIAADLVRRGVASEAHADGYDVVARIGRHTCRICNRYTVGDPSHLEHIHDQFVAAVVRNALASDHASSAV